MSLEDPPFVWNREHALGAACHHPVKLPECQGLVRDMLHDLAAERRDPEPDRLVAVIRRLLPEMKPSAALRPTEMAPA